MCDEVIGEVGVRSGLVGFAVVLGAVVAHFLHLVFEFVHEFVSQFTFALWNILVLHLVHVKFVAVLGHSQLPHHPLPV